MVSNGKRRTINSGIVLELAKEGIESADDVCMFVGTDDTVRDRFALPALHERDQWFRLWENDTAAFETTLARVIGPTPAELMSAGEEAKVRWSFSRIRQFFSHDDFARFTDFFRSLEVRFVLRVFLPCVALKFRRPSTLLREIAETEDIGLLEFAVKIDPTVIFHPRVFALVIPAGSDARRERWELLQTALAGKPDGLDPRQVKYRIGGFLRWLARRANERVTVPALFCMFNYRARAKGNECHDSDLSLDAETFRRGVNRFVAEIRSKVELGQTT